ncbi:MAG TPA: response regulator transcription factor [Acidimicrobiales bacterium]|nr:response regulator transcription factor [Acidimicrobiales bacterium]
MSSILLVEDDASVREAVTMALEGDGHRVSTAAAGDEAIERWRQVRPDLVLLDVMLPVMDGFEVCRRIRAFDQVPIILLTARADPIDVVVGLESGADDYVTKPFETRVLLARVKAVLRRQSRRPEEQTMRFGELTIDPLGMAVTHHGREVKLSPTELKLLLELARRPGQVFTRALLLERVWEYSYLGDSRLVDVCVQRLRSKVEDDPAEPTLIQTVRGVGYKLVAPSTGPGPTGAGA